jgi:hypothetical protein
MSHRKHVAKQHKWANGILTVIEYAFFNLEAALHFAHNEFDGHIKVYNIDGELVYTSGCGQEYQDDCYA